MKRGRRKQVIEEPMNHIRRHNDQVGMETQRKIGGKGGKKSKRGIYRSVMKKPDSL